MSKNFQLLQQMNKEGELIHQPLSARVIPLAKRGKHEKIDELAREEVIRLVQHLFLAPGAEAPRVVVFSGVQHGDGCSRICAHAAATLASRVAGAVCAVDANLNRPSLHRYFGTDIPFGLKQISVNPGPFRSFAQQIGDANLWLLSAGSPVEGELARVVGGTLRSRVAELRAEFDYVLMDAPPINLYADATGLAQVSDGIVLVLGSNSTRREAARRAKENLNAAKVRVLGVVLNKRTFPIPDIIYRKL